MGLKVREVPAGTFSSWPSAIDPSLEITTALTVASPCGAAIVKVALPWAESGVTWLPTSGWELLAQAVSEESFGFFPRTMRTAAVTGSSASTTTV